MSAFETNTYCMGIETSTIIQNETVRIEFSLHCNLYPELYSLSVGVSNKGYDRGLFENYFFLGKDVIAFRVNENPDAIFYAGYYNMKPIVSIKQGNNESQSSEVLRKTPG